VKQNKWFNIWVARLDWGLLPTGVLPGSGCFHTAMCDLHHQLVGYVGQVGSATLGGLYSRLAPTQAAWHASSGRERHLWQICVPCKPLPVLAET